MSNTQEVTLKELSGRSVTLWLNNDNTVSLLGGLNHGTKLVIDQELVNSLQNMVNEIQKQESFNYVMDSIDLDEFE